MPLTLAAAAAATWGALHGLMGPARAIPTRELLLAAGIVIVASEMALLPMKLALGLSPGAVSQAGLMATLVQMFLSISLAGAVYMMRLAPDRNIFLYLVVALYWISLVTLVIACVREVRRADPSAATNAHVKN
jgi:hypothetical protein